MTRRAGAVTLTTEAVLTALRSLRLAHRRAMPARALTRTVPVGLTARLPDREFRLLPLGCLSFRTRERRADQPPMHWTVVFPRAIVVATVFVARVSIRRHRGEFNIRGQPRIVSRNVDVVSFIEFRFIRNRWSGGDGTRRPGVLGYVLGYGASLLTADRSFSLLVFVLGVAGGAARLLHVSADHGDDDVVRHPSLARTIVVENVTEPKPALLHELPRNGSFQLELKTGAGRRYSGV